MGGFFGVVTKRSKLQEERQQDELARKANLSECLRSLYYGTDYHSHLGNQRGGLLVCDDNGRLKRSIHDISNAQFRTKFQDDLRDLDGATHGIGSISDTGDQPLMLFSGLGHFGLTMVGKITNLQSLCQAAFRNNHVLFAEKAGDSVNPTELAASLVSMEGNFKAGILNAQNKIEGSCSMLILSKEGVWAVRDRYGRTPVVIGESEGSYAATFETCAFPNLGYKVVRWLGPGEAVLLTQDGIQNVLPPRPEMKICAFLWIYYGFPASSYEGINVEHVRNRCGEMLAKHEGIEEARKSFDAVVGVPDSGTAHALGYAQAAGLPYRRAFVKYTPTWPRSFIPANQSSRALVASMKLLPVEDFVKDNRLLFCEDSVVRGTQLRDTIVRLKELGVKEIHMRAACPPILFNCKYLNFSPARTVMELASRRAIAYLEGDCEKNLDEYMKEGSEKYEAMVRKVSEELHLTSLKYQTLDDMIRAIGLPKEKLCTYCWDGKD